MKRIIAIILVIIPLLLNVQADEQGASQEQRLLALVKEVQTQQAVIAENQEKIAGKLATIAEAVRLARIFASRGGR